MLPASRDLNQLNPQFREKVDLFLSECPQIFVTEAGRTAERQKELVLKGLSFVEVSNHQLGLAIDIAFLGEELYPQDYGRWRKVADSAKRYGLDWGFDMWNWDKPHFQDNGLPLNLELEKTIEENNVILEQRKVKANRAIEEVNATVKFIAELEGSEYKPYKII